MAWTIYSYFLLNFFIWIFGVGGREHLTRWEYGISSRENVLGPSVARHPKFGHLQQHPWSNPSNHHGPLLAMTERMKMVRQPPFGRLLVQWPPRKIKLWRDGRHNACLLVVLFFLTLSGHAPSQAEAAAHGNTRYIRQCWWWWWRTVTVGGFTFVSPTINLRWYRRCKWVFYPSVQHSHYYVRVSTAQSSHVRTQQSLSCGLLASEGGIMCNKKCMNEED
jgi:hypothetical protein